MAETRRFTLTIWIFVGFFLGIAAGAVAGESALPFSRPLADIFLRLLRMAILPLVITSIISSIIQVGSAYGLGRMGLRTLGYYLSTSIIAIFTGQVLVNLFKPGAGAEIHLEESPDTIAAAEMGLGEIFLNIIPENPIASAASGDVLPVIFFSILFGLFVTQLNTGQRDLLGGFFEAAFEAMMKMVSFIIWTAPLGVFGIITGIVATSGFSAFRSLGFYFIIVLAGLAIHMFFTLPLLLWTLGRVSPLKHYRGMLPALLTAFSTCSTIVTLPLTIKAVTSVSGASRKSAGFVLPIGATVNMDGTALYECVAAIFIAQVYGFDLSLGGQVTVAATAVLASIGAASIPMSGMVMMSIVLGAVGLPLEGVGIILAVDRILDMFRTTVNVFSDSCGAVIISRFENSGHDNPRQG